MALVWTDSFDNISNAALVSKYDPAEVGFGIQTGTPARTGTRSLGLATLHHCVTKPLPVTGTTAIVGFAIYVPAGSLTSVHELFLAVQEGSIRHMSVGMDYNPSYGSAYKLAVARGSTILQTSVGTFQANTWYYLEFLTTIHASAGSYELRVDTVPVVTGAGVATTNGGIGVWNRIGLHSPVTGSSFVYFDDLYVCDGSGATRNAFLGIQRVESMLMKTDAVGLGTHHEWTPSSGTDHGAMVDEASPDDDATYNTAIAGSPLKDSYQHQPLTLTGAVNGIQINPSWKKNDVGGCTARTLTVSGGVTGVGATQSPLTTYSTMPQVVERNPDGNVDWTVATVNAAEFGVERLT